MPAVATRTSIVVASAAVQGAALWDAQFAALLAAGYTVLTHDSNHMTGSVRSAKMRPPPLDRYSTRCDFIWLWANSGGLNFAHSYLYDYDILAVIPTIAATSGAPGTWAAGTWPTTGTPTITTTILQGTIAVDGTAGDFYVLVSEYGIATIYLNDSSTNNFAQVLASQIAIDPIRGVREIGVHGTTAASTTTFAAPTGAAHLTVHIEGVDVDITFPVGVPLNSFRVAQEITRQLGGFGEAEPRSRRSGSDNIMVRIPTSRAPVAGYSTTRPLLSLIYQDPTVRTAGLNFAAGPNLWTVSGNNLSIGGFNFIQHKVRIGATVRNHTLNVSTTVECFNGLGNVATLMSAAGWTSTHTIEVYPGPEDHATSYGANAGIWQMVLSGNETAHITDGADRLVVLNDYYGEAQGQYEVGQNVVVANNGMAVNLALAARVGTFVRGEEVEVTMGGGLGTRGIIRGVSVDNNTIAVDTIEGASGSGTPYMVVPWQGTDTITGQMSGATAVITPSNNAAANIGWSGRVPILAIGQVDPGAGDHRTTLLLDLDDAVVNTALTLSPGSVVGSRGKVRAHIDYNANARADTVYIPRVGGSSSITADDTDVNRHELDLAVEPARSPDYETGSLQIAEIVARWPGAAAQGYQSDIITTFAHVRTLNGRSSFGPGNRHYCAEDGDLHRNWFVGFEINQVNVGYSAGSSPASAVWVALGPVELGEFD